MLKDLKPYITIIRSYNLKFNQTHGFASERWRSDKFLGLITNKNNKVVGYLHLNTFDNSIELFVGVTDKCSRLVRKLVIDSLVEFDRGCSLMKTVINPMNMWKVDYMKDDKLGTSQALSDGFPNHLDIRNKSLINEIKTSIDRIDNKAIS